MGVINPTNVHVLGKSVNDEFTVVVNFLLSDFGKFQLVSGRFFRGLKKKACRMIENRSKCCAIFPFSYFSI